MASTVMKGSVVEVSSDEPGFHGAWYVATIVDIIDPSSIKTPSSSKNKNKNITKKTTTTGYLVKYETLFQENKLDEHLTEVVEASYVRPLPPRYPKRNGNDNVVVESESESGDVLEFEVGDCIDAYHRDGWWMGLVKEKVTSVLENDNKFVVSFENPPEQFEFKASQLRFHVNWVHTHWEFPVKELGDKNAATQTSESTNTTDAQSGFITPCKGPKTTDSDNQTVGARLASLRRTGSRKKPETKRETPRSVSNTRKKRRMSFAEEDSRGKRPQASAGSKRNNKFLVSGTETSGSEAIQQHSPLVEKEAAITETCNTEEANSPQKRKRGRTPMLQVEKPNGVQQDDQETCKGDSSALDEIATDIDEQPLATWVHGLHPLSFLKRRTCGNPPDQNDESRVALNQDFVNKYQQDWPFIKRSPIWDTILSLEAYQTPVQKPHFSPLKKVSKKYREGFAIGYMVTFGGLVEDISKIQLSDPLHIINDAFETLADLEAHGFNVDFIQTRLNEFVTWKVKVSLLKDKLKKVENELEKHTLEKSTIEEEMSQLEVKMLELKEKMVQAETEKNLKDEELKGLQSNLDIISTEIQNWALSFERLAATPLQSK